MLMMMTLTVATQSMEADAVKELDEEDNTKFTLVVMAVIFLLGFLTGVCCTLRGCHTAHAAERPRPTRVSTATATDADEPEPELRQPLLTTEETTTPPPPAVGGTRCPQSIYVSGRGTQYHVRRNCTGLTGREPESRRSLLVWLALMKLTEMEHAAGHDDTKKLY